MPGPTQNSNPVDTDRLLKELAMMNQRISALTKMVIEVRARIPDISHPRIAHASLAEKRPSGKEGAVNSIQGMKAHDDQ